ncbi:MAG TPA: hypothetical protein G4N96_13980 [Chloroflexi bacterium]|nr:hypothetical protein [Chloroflexota bacterium]
MDTPQLIALIVVALVILAVIIVFRRRIALTLKAWGIDLTLEGENEGKSQPAALTPPAGVEVEDIEVTDGGLLVYILRGVDDIHSTKNPETISKRLSPDQSRPQSRSQKLLSAGA